jgi:hypothetical protein
MMASRPVARHDGPERCFVTESDPVGAAATACTLTAADAAACPAVAGSCAKSAGDGSCTYIKAVASTDPNLGGLKDICPAKVRSLAPCANLCTLTEIPSCHHLACHHQGRPLAEPAAVLPVSAP